MRELQPPAAPIRVSITGHRPQKLTATKEEIAQALATVFRALHAGVVHQGMAAGVDLTAAAPQTPFAALTASGTTVEAPHRVKKHNTPHSRVDTPHPCV